MGCQFSSSSANYGEKSLSFFFSWLFYIYFEKLLGSQQSCIRSRVSMTFGTDLLPCCQALSFLSTSHKIASSSSYQDYGNAAAAGSRSCCCLNCLFFNGVQCPAPLSTPFRRRASTGATPKWHVARPGPAAEWQAGELQRVGRVLWYSGWNSVTG